MTSSAPRTRLGIIGTGLAVQKLHWPALARLGDAFEIVAFANHTRPKAEHFSSYSGVPMERYHDDYRALLGRSDVDAVLISLPIGLTYTVTREALEAGKHVLCEKPAGANLGEAYEFIELGKRFPDRVILVAENWFYRDDLRFARTLLDRDEIGEVRLASWRHVAQLIPREDQFSSTPWRHHIDYEGGAHLDGGVHHTAEIRLLLGDAARLQAEIQDANSTHDGPSIMTMNLAFVSGAVGNYTASYPEIPAIDEPNELRIYGTKGQMVLARNEVRVATADGTSASYTITQRDGGYYNEFLDFHDAVTAGITPVGTIEQSFRNMELILLGLESARTGSVLQPDPAVCPLVAEAVPLWVPRGADGRFDGVDVEIVKQ
ncbi:MAG TPA: Gfo/Idh/MocA family oxidoreductase [Thermomicrobiales bacterium]|nr:Gfo/Idh/MocA family oxidoreductase [Thermomicrobiales bacterium]